jgi:hypothetical protein
MKRRAKLPHRPVARDRSRCMHMLCLRDGASQNCDGLPGPRPHNFVLILDGDRRF